MPEMLRLEQPHADLHQKIRQIVDLREKGDLPAAEKIYLEVEPLSEQVVALLNRIEQKSQEQA